ncbi:MAG: bifunctional oligoribonuclease/PAP phosphatase NrnA, partial [Muribaculaceae bacterium]|nr:bifunctional oligoribonuclease/PAP phosphatase NrnA [Muribaculaceae bacterium]
EIIYSAFLREEDGYVKVSMRSQGDFPVNVLCSEYFGGGGHLNAAGGEFPGTLDECATLFRSLLKENKEKYIDKDNSNK